MVIDKTSDELKEAYLNYKKGKYTFGKYGSGDQIIEAFQKRKIFVLTSSNKGFLSFIIMIPFIVFLLISFGFGSSFESLFNLIIGIMLIITGIMNLFLIFITKRYFVVIGPLGIYYRKIIMTNCFQWNEITLAERGIQTIKSYTRYGGTITNVIAVVNFILPDGSQIKFNSARYKSKEFVKWVKREMFINLFQTYSELSNIEYMERFRTDKNSKD